MKLGFLLGFAPGAALGVGRFAYALVLPAMQLALGLSYAQAGFLGSANTGGYLLGALISHRVLETTSYRRGIYVSLWLQAISLALLAVTQSFYLLTVLRFVQGVLGAFVFVGGAALLLASGGKGTATGIYFGGVGIGILLSPLILPLMTTWQVGWLLLAGLSVVMTLVSYLAYGNLNEPERRNVGEGGSLRPLAPLLVAYGLYGAGYIGYMTFVTTGLSVAILPFWVVLGLGASFTGLAWGPVVERFGGEAGMALVLLCLAGSSLYPLVVTLPWLSAFVFGISFLGVITAITDVFRQLLPPSGWGRAMGLSTACFATGQAVGPSLSGLVGDLVGGPAGALGLSTGLLAVALFISVVTVVRLKASSKRGKEQEVINK